MANSPLCSIPDCGKLHYGKGWCQLHYNRWRRTGSPEGRGEKDNPPCSVPGCDSHSIIRGWCSKHYQRWRKHGDPMETNGTERGTPLKFLQEVVLRHSDDTCLVWPFSVDQNGYGKIRYEGSAKRVNGIVCTSVHGPAPTALHEVAHSCGRGSSGCCSPHHLSWKTHTENEADKLVHGTRRTGENHPRSRLTNAQVREIRSLSGVIPQREIAGMFGIARSQVSEVVNRRTYASVD